MSNFLYTNSGASTTRTSLTSVGLLARAGAQQVETLSYADCYLFMAMVGGLAFCFIPLLAPSVAAPKQAEQLLPSRIEKERRRLEGKCTPKRFIWGIDAGVGQALAYISF